MLTHPSTSLTHSLSLLPLPRLSLPRLSLTHTLLHCRIQSPKRILGITADDTSERANPRPRSRSRSPSPTMGLPAVATSAGRGGGGGGHGGKSGDGGGEGSWWADERVAVDALAVRGLRAKVTTGLLLIHESLWLGPC